MPIDKSIQGKQRFLLQRDNLLSDASISTADILPAGNSVKRNQPIRAANSTGIVKLTGDYSGLNDATYDVVITADTSTTERRVSTPIFAGAGSGSTMTDVSAQNTVAAQSVRVTLKSLGTDDQTAKLNFYGYELKSRIPQTGGNRIRIILDRSAIVSTASGYATPDDANKDAYRFEGSNFDFGGAYELTAGGKLNGLTRRFSFGIAPTVYRQYRATEDGKDVIYIDPPLTERIPRDTPVNTITGTYSVTVELNNDDGALTRVNSNAYSVGEIIVIGSDVFQVIEAGTSNSSPPTFDTGELGAQTIDGSVIWSYAASASSETFSGITTFFDLLVSLLSSVLVEIRGEGDTPPVINKDETPGGIDAEDIPFITEAYYRNLRSEGSENVEKIQNINFSVSGNQPTQEIRLTCVDNMVNGSSIWRVVGTGSGTLGTVREGTIFSQSGIEFMVPKKNPVTSEDSQAPVSNGQVQVKSTDFAAQTGATGTFPKACMIAVVKGPNIRNETLTFTYRRRHDPACDCTTVTFNTTLNPACVGGDQVDINEKTLSSLSVYSPIPAEIQTRIAGIRSWLGDSQISAIAIDTYTHPYYNSTYQYETGSRAKKLNLFRNIVIVFERFLYEMSGALNAGIINQTQFDSAMANYDSTYANLLIDPYIQLLLTGNTVYLATSGELYPTKYASKFNLYMALVGVKPYSPLDAIEDIGDGEACWTDHGGTHWWEVESSLGYSYLPMFTNQNFYAVFESLDADGTITYVSANTIGFQLAIGCSGSLSEGDQIVVEVFATPGTGGSVVSNRYYQLGDRFRVDIVGSSPKTLQNGVAGDNVHTWAVVADKLGKLPDYSVIDGSEAAYNQSGISFKITRGGVPNSLNDQWLFSILANQYKWRKDAGAYSADADIPASPVSIGDGLSIEFSEGVGKSFENGDSFSFVANQPNSPAHVLTPTSDVWVWDTASFDISLDMGAAQAISMVCIPWHTLPATATLSIELRDISNVLITTLSPQWNADGIYVDLSPGQAGVRYIRVIGSNALGGSISWIWAGSPVYFYTEADSMIIRRSRKMGELAQSGARLHLARGYNGQISWSSASGASGWIYDEDLTTLDNLFSYLKAADDEAFSLIPNIDHGKSYMLRLSDDVLEPIDDMAYGLDDLTEQVFSASLTFREVWME